MQLGIDLGTTRTVVAEAERGNYPVVSFPDTRQDRHGYIPTVVAVDGDTLVYGFEALRAAEKTGAPLLRSFKRALASPDVTETTTVRIGDTELNLLDVVTGFLTSVREQLASSAATPSGPDDRTMIAVPAHAHNGQRLLTMEAFTRAGFSVTGVVNEPSAAGFEYTHRQPRSLTSRRSRVIVYDLGGGTFDASLLRIDQTSHEVLASLGVNRLGGDDFDETCATLALSTAGVERSALDAVAWADLVDECRVAKEGLSPQSRRMVVDVAGSPVVIPVPAFYSAVTPLVQQSIDAMAPLIGGLDGDDLADVAGIYLVGGGTELPLVPRMLRERFGRRVHRSPMPGASTAIGLAIAADPQSGYALADRLSRGFGVFREWDEGHTVAFDAIFSPHDLLPSSGVKEVVRRYRAAHNIGCFRFVECSGITAQGTPAGDLNPYPEVRFPYDADLQGHELTGIPIHRRDGGPVVEERFTVDPAGLVSVTITDLETGFRYASTLHH